MRTTKLFILIILSMVCFFNPGGIFSSQGAKLLRYVVFVISFIFCIKAENKYSKDDYPFYSYWGLIMIFVLSIIPSFYFHDQPFLVSIIAILPYLTSYLYFYVFLRLSIPKNTIYNVIKFILILSGIIYAVNFVTFPHPVFGEEKEEYDMTRGLVRLWIPFLELHVLGLFYAINQWVLYGGKKYVCWIFYALIMIFLSVTRQHIFYSVILGMWMLLRNSSLYKKIIVCVVMSSIVFWVLPHISAYQTMIELTNTQKEKNEDKDDIRLLAWQFYTKEAQTNEISPIVGNGFPALDKSQWGNQMRAVVDYNHCHAVDVGWAGFYFYFGALGVICLGYLLFASIRRKKVVEEKYLNYWLIYIVLISFTSAPIIYPAQIFSIMLVLYLIYQKNEKDSHSYSKL